MATARAKELMGHEAQQRIDAATGALADRFGVTLPPPSEVVRDAEYTRVAALQRLADILEMVASAVSDNPDGAGSAHENTAGLLERIAELEQELEAARAGSADDEQPEDRNPEDAPPADDAPPAPVADPPADAAGDAPVAPDYASLKVAELRALLEDRGIEVPGKATRADLIERLELITADAGDGDPTEDDAPDGGAQS